MPQEPWIGVDLDGTLARYDGWKGPQHIGEPIPEILSQVRDKIAKGTKVKIFTARASVPDDVIYIKWWLKDLGLDLEVTCIKDHAMIELWDDNCRQVEKNTGRFVVPYVPASIPAYIP